MGQIVTFYSYKGGVGRTMALANVATLLAQWGYRMLLVDWDLEAPGLEFYFKETLDNDDKFQLIPAKKGLVDLLEEAHLPVDEKSSNTLDWKSAIVDIDIPGVKEHIHLITSGSRDKSGSYFDKVTQLDWDSFYNKKGGFLIEHLRNQWKDAYDYVMIDSRTGITDIGGICTIQLPDILVLLFTATEQSFKGVLDVAAKAQVARWDLPFDRFGLTCLPVPSRFDSSEEFKISQQWLGTFAKGLKNVYDDWLPNSVDRKQFLEVTKIPYSSYFSFGEKLPVLEQGTTDPTGLGYAYENLAAIISSNFESVKDVLDNRDQLITKQSSQKEEVRIFILHSSVPRASLDFLYEQLTSSGYRPWIDMRDVLPGQSIISSVFEALSESDILLYCFSNEQVDKESQKTDSSVISAVNTYAGQAPYVIPVNFGNSEVVDVPPIFQRDITSLKWLDYQDAHSFNKLIEAIEHWKKSRSARDIGHKRTGVSSNRKINQRISHLDRTLSRKGHPIHKLRAKDSTGRWAYYFVLVEHAQEHEFLSAISSGQVIDLEDYGKVIASNYGETPSEVVLGMLRDKYGSEI